MLSNLAHVPELAGLTEGFFLALLPCVSPPGLRGAKFWNAENQSWDLGFFSRFSIMKTAIFINHYKVILIDCVQAILIGLAQKYRLFS